jgi:hypothetical protein
MSLAKDIDHLNTLAANNRGILSSESRPLIEHLCREFDPTQMDPLQLSRDTHNLLLQYAGACSVEAVRENSIVRLRSGITALAIEDGKTDIRDSVLLLPRFFHSACLLQLDTTVHFAEYAGICRSEAAARQFRAFSVPPGTPSARLESSTSVPLETDLPSDTRTIESLIPPIRMYLRSPGLSLSQKLGFIVLLLRQNRHKWQFWRRG